jgi:hypothetical protein
MGGGAIWEAVWACVDVAKTTPPPMTPANFNVAQFNLTKLSLRTNRSPSPAMLTAVLTLDVTTGYHLFTVKANSLR